MTKKSERPLDGRKPARLRIDDPVVIHGIEDCRRAISVASSTLQTIAAVIVTGNVRDRLRAAADSIRLALRDLEAASPATRTAVRGRK